MCSVRPDTRSGRSEQKFQPNRRVWRINVGGSTLATRLGCQLALLLSMFQTTSILPRAYAAPPFACFLATWSQIHFSAPTTSPAFADALKRPPAQDHIAFPKDLLQLLERDCQGLEFADWGEHRRRVVESLPRYRTKYRTELPSP